MPAGGEGGAGGEEREGGGCCFPSGERGTYPSGLFAHLSAAALSLQYLSALALRSSQHPPSPPKILIPHHHPGGTPLAAFLAGFTLRLRAVESAMV